jgi:hypothetical protein
MSAKQYAYTQANPEPYTPRLDYHLCSAVADFILRDYYKEYGSTYIQENFNISFSCDGIRFEDGDTYIAEHKFLYKDELDDWKIRSAATQVLLYTALAKKCRKLTPRTFSIDKRKESINISDFCFIEIYVTTFENVYLYTQQVLDDDLNRVLEFYTKKAQGIWNVVSRKNWDEVTAWDGIYKHKEYDEFFGFLTIQDFKQLV